jgi:hypothetical protein
MTGEDQQIGHSAARRMLDAFTSVGATSFDITWTTLAGEKDGFRRAVTHTEFARGVPALLDDAIIRQRNLIVRPHGPDVTFVQLDDVVSAMLPRLAPAVFITLQTSPANYQAWIAIAAAENKDFARRLRQGAGADASASGATRLAGSLNFKEKYAPDFPRVALGDVNAGRKATMAGLDQLGLVAPPEAAARALMVPRRSFAKSGNRKWPSYDRCLQNAPPSQSRPGKTRGSIADFVWCMTAISWGWSLEETSARLIEESEKARENGEGYAALTARNAAAAVERRQKSSTTASALTPGGHA